MGRRVPSYTLFLPPAGAADPVDQPRWRVLYQRNGATLPVEVCAADEETAVMRAGMKRAELLRLERQIFPAAVRQAGSWERLSVELVG